MTRCGQSKPKPTMRPTASSMTKMTLTIRARQPAVKVFSDKLRMLLEWAMIAVPRLHPAWRDRNASLRMALACVLPLQEWNAHVEHRKPTRRVLSLLQSVKAVITHTHTHTDTYNQMPSYLIACTYLRIVRFGRIVGAELLTDSVGSVESMSSGANPFPGMVVASRSVTGSTLLSPYSQPDLVALRRRRRRPASAPPRSATSGA
eukprot:COSAG05_NODE_1284_length_5281_cov_19.439599_4_plen_204_part_00